MKPHPNHRKPHRLTYAHRLAERQRRVIDLVVIHCTELPNLDAAREYAERIHYPGSETGTSGHYYIDRDGTIENWVPVHRIAHHIRGFNERSIGIELVNKGRFPDWYHSSNQQMRESYPQPQVDALLELLHDLQQEHRSLRWIAGHEQLDREQVPSSDNPDIMVFRKRDPGPMFPWPRVFARISLKPWPEENR